MPQKETVLIVDDELINRRILDKILQDSYTVFHAENGSDALRVLDEQKGRITAIILDLIMPVMDGYTFLQVLSGDVRYRHIPTLVTTGDSDNESELRALELGAWDFIRKPYNAKILLFRLKNNIVRSHLSAYNQIKHLLDFDTLTGLYSKTHFFHATRELLDQYPERQFMLVRFDIDRFQLVNAFFGTDEGDHLLQHIANVLRTQMRAHPYATYGRIEADIFSFCIPTAPHEIVLQSIEEACRQVQAYLADFNVTLSFGIYEITDPSLAVSLMYDRATLAARHIKGNCLNTCSFYSYEMGEQLAKDQEIINDMNTALEQNQFVVYFQPKYSLKTDLPAGAEALVRWEHPAKGMISPGAFIPVFERNGFISKLDYYVWESVCRTIRGWLDAGLSPAPISVNVSRVNLYNPKLVENLSALTQRYGVPNQLLQLELTESVYTESPDIISDTVDQLHNYGFTVLMDDFGSGYSSLNILKSIDIDYLKIDMAFFGAAKIPGRGENIVASVIRMAKWLGLPTIAEGVEQIQQVDFLREIGCEYIQGYFFARPMPLGAYEQLVAKSAAFHQEKTRSFNLDNLWVSNPQMELLFSGLTQPVAIYEYEIGTENIEIIRANEAFLDLFPGKGERVLIQNPLQVIRTESRQTVLQAFSRAAQTRATADCEYQRLSVSAPYLWMRLNLKYIASIENRYILLGTLLDISMQKQIELELFKYRSALSGPGSATNRILIVEDSETNRAILNEMFCDKYTVLQAGDGAEALNILSENNDCVDIILLDLTMPGMDGVEFLQRRNEQAALAQIPVIIITVDDSAQQQINLLNMGVDDYIVKPFVPEIVHKRVNNVLESHKRFRQMLREYQNVVTRTQSDALTQVYTRAAAEDLILKRMDGDAQRDCALIVVDVDDLKRYNCVYGHAAGDLVLEGIAHMLRSFFDGSDIVSRSGGDAFAVFTDEFATVEALMARIAAFHRAIEHLSPADAPSAITVSIGVATGMVGAQSYPVLCKNADAALDTSKQTGKNRVTLFDDKCHVSADGRPVQPLREDALLPEKDAPAKT